MGKTDTAAHPEFEARGTFEHLRLGRSEVRHDPRTLRLASYLDDAVVLPEIPPSFDWTSSVPAWPMYGNDHLGDCTIAAAGHLIQAWTAAAGSPVTPEPDSIEHAYWSTGSEDNGRVEVDVLNYWRKTGIAGRQIIAYAYLDPKNLDHLCAAIYLFGGVYVGIDLPKSAQGQPVWDVVGDGASGDSAPGSWGGHAVPYVAYQQRGKDPLPGGLGALSLKTVTWGAVLDVTDAFHVHYCDEAYVPISLDFLKDGASPAGFDVAALTADLAEIGKVAAAQQIDDQVQAGDPGIAPDEVPDPNAGIENLDADGLRDEIDSVHVGGSDYYWQG